MAFPFAPKHIARIVADLLTGPLSIDWSAIDRGIILLTRASEK